MNRYPHLHELAALLRTVETAPATAPAAVRGLLVDWLPEGHRAVLDWMAAFGQPVTCRLIGHKLDYQFRYARTMLNQMHEWGVLAREGRPCDHGVEFWYTVAGVLATDVSK